jgi:hypothetical protein
VFLPVFNAEPVVNGHISESHHEFTALIENRCVASRGGFAVKLQGDRLDVPRFKVIEQTTAVVIPAHPAGEPHLAAKVRQRSGNIKGDPARDPCCANWIGFTWNRFVLATLDPVPVESTQAQNS